MSTEETELIDRLVRLVRRAIDAEYVEVAISGEVLAQSSIAESPLGESLIRDEHLSWMPRFGPADELTLRPELSGSVVVVPITGPSAEQGALLAYSAVEGEFDEQTLDRLKDGVVLVECYLDQFVERIRLDQVTDVLRQNQDDLHATQAKLELSNNELEQFAYIAAHELVAPLRSVAVYAEVLDMSSGDLDDAQLQSCAREIRDGVALMDRQVQHLLELSSTQEQAADPVPVNLSEVVDAAVESLRDHIDEVGATIEVQQLPTVRGRWVLLQSVFVNLVSNALKYRDQSQPLTIAIESDTTGDGHSIRVIDNGPGIDQEDRERIFRLFERASTTAPGSGIGLGLSRRIIEAFAGTLTYQDSDAGGACFVLTFPIAPYEEAEGRARAS